MPYTSHHASVMGVDDVEAPEVAARPGLAGLTALTGAVSDGPASEPAPRRSADPLRILPAIDVLTVAVAWLLAYATMSTGAESFGHSVVRASALGGLAFLLASHARLYDAATISDRCIEAAGVLRLAAGTGLVALTAPLFTQGATDVMRAAVGGLLSMVLVGTGRGLLHAWLRHERAAGRHLQSVAVISYRAAADRLVELLAHRPDLGMRVCALAGDWETAYKHGLDWIGWPRDAVDALAATGATGVVISPVEMPFTEYNYVAQELARRGFDVYCSTGLRQVGHGRLRPTALANESFYSLAPPELAPRQRLVKRLLDLTITLGLLVVSAPLLLAVAATIKLGDRGPVFFRQVRIGRDGEPFTVLKFRTMVVDAEARLAELRAQNARSGPLFKVAADPRITRVGRILRATSLDELPQLFNVLGGTMSLVGPRPALPSEVATFDQRHLGRHRVPPGVTGLWQVEARDNPSFAAYRHLDVFYVENWSCGLDLVILWNTVPAIVARALRSLLRRQDIVAPSPDQPGTGEMSPERAASTTAVGA